MKLPLPRLVKVQAKAPEVDTEKKRRHAVGTKYTHAQWERFINEWEESGLTQKLFCEQKGINSHTFANQRTRILKQGSDKQSFLEIDVINPLNRSCANERGFVLHCASGSKLSIPNDCDKATLKELFILLGVC